MASFDNVIADLAGREVGAPSTRVISGVTQIGPIAVDASMHEVHTMSGEATDHPVEDGSTISDHVNKRPRRFQIDGIITNHPIKLPGSHVEGVREVQKEFTWTANPQIPLLGTEMGGAGLIGMALGAIASATGLDQHTGTATGFEPDFNRVQDVMDEFEALMDAADPVDIVTTLRVYHNMVIEQLSVDRDKSSGNALRFSAQAKQVRTVSTAYAPRVPEPLVERGKPEVKRGKQSARSVSPGSTADDAAAASAGTEKTSLLHGMLF